jgi:peptidoglycan-associated lipoprotein
MTHDAWLAEIAAARRRFEDQNAEYYKTGLGYSDAVHPAVIAKELGDFLAEYVGSANNGLTPPSSGSATSFALRAGASLLLRTSRTAAPPPPAAAPTTTAPTPTAPPPVTPPPPTTTTPPPAAAPVDPTPTILANLSRAVYFDYDKADIRADQRATLDAKGAIMRANPGLRIRIEGHADERGSDEYNLALGMRRAQQSKQYLVDNFDIDAARIAITSFGEERPVCQQQDESCWGRNRRDEFAVTAGGTGLRPPPAP